MSSFVVLYYVHFSYRYASITSGKMLSLMLRCTGASRNRAGGYSYKGVSRKGATADQRELPAAASSQIPFSAYCTL